jgi:5-methylcytosine-specific restriction endonuclease McrA
MPARTGRPWQRIKRRIIRRDRGVCHLCGLPGADTADHLIPYSAGGSNAPANLKAAHVDCNRRRGARPIEVARAEIAAEGAQSGWEW